MKKYLFTLIIFFLLCENSRAQEYIWKKCDVGLPAQFSDDSIILSAGNEDFSFERVRYCERGMSYYYDSGNDSLSDSLLNHVRTILKPYFGKWVSHIEVLRLWNYNEWEDDSANIAEHPYCKKMKYDYLCRICFDDSMFFRFSVHTDGKGNILNKIDIPHGLDTLRQFALYSPCEIYQKAKADKFFGGDPPRYAGVDLCYSNRLKIMYYEVECSEISGKYYDREKSDKNTFPVRFIFYNAVTGKVIWRTTATRTIERSADYENTQTGFKENLLMNTY